MDQDWWEDKWHLYEKFESFNRHVKGVSGTTYTPHMTVGALKLEAVIKEYAYFYFYC